MNIVLEQIEEEIKYIDEYPLTTTSGTEKVMEKYHESAVEKRNAYIDKKIEYYTLLQELIYNELNNRYNSLLPTDSSKDYEDLNKKIDTFKKILKYNNQFNDVYEKLDLDKIVSNINDSDVTDLSRVNSLIDRLLSIFEKASINLTIDDFNYSMYVKQYMEVYYTSRTKETFVDDMLKIFDKLYWECPNILTHIKLCIKSIYRKYEKELVNYCENYKNSLLQEQNVSNDTVFDNYNRLNTELEDKQSKDKYLLSIKFLNGELSIHDYLEDSPQRKKQFNSLFIDKEFTDLDDFQKGEFFKEMRNLKHITVELTNYNKYRELIKDLLLRYQKRDSYKGTYQSKLKEIEPLEKQRESLCQELIPKKKGFSFFRKKKQRDSSLVKVELNDVIKKLDELYVEANDAKINEIIGSRLNDASTLNDGLELIVSFYPYFKTLYSKLNADQKDFDYIKEYTDLFYFVYDTDNIFIRKIKLNDKQEINDLIYEKYKILNLNITKEQLENQLSELEQTINYINLVNDINNSDISFETIKFLVDFQKIEKTSKV